MQLRIHLSDLTDAQQRSNAVLTSGAKTGEQPQPCFVREARAVLSSIEREDRSRRAAPLNIPCRITARINLGHVGGGGIRDSPRRRGSE